MPQLPASFAGSISEATLHPKHLVPRYAAVLAVAEPDHTLVKEYVAVRDAVRELAAFLARNPDDLADEIGLWEDEQTGYLLEALFDALNEVAPEGTYFSASEGDGASFGFWELEEDDGSAVLHLEGDVTFNPTGQPSYFSGDARPIEED